ncbi:antibiotic biosynthesis monooxygenase [Paraglaciecola sp. 20A4]|uniref:putative quinol monooxygenase n=1 Tax=Paraglaciecola sp. 20A4 TaxID=2687288 RepID=UPI00140C1300|nr:antibiotic biosynthesis monooxygenase [Paraglaciecola sp. 20A4]
MLTQIVKFDVKPKYVETFKQALKLNQLGASNEAGLIEIRLFQGKQAVTKFFAYERWESAEALAEHGLQPYTKEVFSLGDKALNAPVEVMKLNDTTPAPLHENNPKYAQPEDDVFSIFFIFKIKPEYRSELLTQFTTHIKHTRKEEPGNIVFDLYTVNGQDDTLVVYEHWRKESDVWDIHFNQPYAVNTGKLMEKAVVGELAQYMHFVTEI